MDRKTSLIFFGTDEFAKIVLDALKKADFDIVAEITEPLSSEKLTKLMQLKKLKADLGVVAVYGKILSKKILEHFPCGVLNIHPSLLPKYRGPSPIRTAIANGDTETGVTIIKLNEKMDAGPVVANRELRIMNNEMHSELRDRLAKAGAELLIDAIPKYIEDKIELKPQDESQARYTKMLTRDDGKVDLAVEPLSEIYNKFRAYEDWPGIWFMHKSRNMKYESRIKILDLKIENGKLKIEVLQPEGKKPMSLKDFENGYGWPTGLQRAS